MNVRIIIDGTLVYHPHTHIVHALNNEHNRVTVAVPASLCLMLLIKRQGIIVSQSELLDVAWNTRGINVSANTLYQNIFLLRKALQKVSGSATIIRTVPKRGFIISNETEIAYADEMPQPAPLVNVDTIEPHIIEEPAKLPDAVTHVPPPVSSFKTLRLSMAILLLFVACAVSTFYLSSRQLPSFSFERYDLAMRLDDCKIYRNASLRRDAFFANFIAYHQLKCGKAKWWYLTNNPPSERVSLIKCMAPIDKATGAKKGFCMSSYYLGLSDRG